MILANRKHLLVPLTLLATGFLGVASASAAPIPPESLGVNVLTSTVGGQLAPSDLAVGSASGIGVVRAGVNQGSNADSLVTLAATAHLRFAPVLGLADQLSPASAATAMAQYVSSFAQRYGPGGTFWAQNPTLPYLPVEAYEIGNEPNIPLEWVADNTHLHWTDPSAYAQVYEAARAALHQADSSGVALVGGLADSGNLGVDLAHDEEWLATLTPGTVDAVGYHPYTFPVSFPKMYSDTEALRQWMDANGMRSAPIEINEYGACDILPQDTLDIGSGCLPSISSSDWGAFAAGFTEWALCSPALHVDGTEPFYWGDLPTTDIDALLSLVSSAGVLTPYGQDYLAEAQSLSAQGCPLSPASPPTITGSPVRGQWLTSTRGSWSAPSAPTLAYQWERCNADAQCADIAGATSASYEVQPGDVGSRLLVSVTARIPAGSVTAWSSPTAAVRPAASAGRGGSTARTATLPPSMRLWVSGVRVRRHLLTITVHAIPGSVQVTVLASKGRHRVRVRVVRHQHRNTVLTFTGKLSAGRWKLTVACRPPWGYTMPRAVLRTVTVPR